MLSLPGAVKVFLCRTPVNMQKSFDGLPGEVRRILSEDPLSGHLFVFSNRRGNLLKILYWDRDGYAIWSKRLERGVFKFPNYDSAKLQIDLRVLHSILQGIIPERFSKRFFFDNQHKSA